MSGTQICISAPGKPSLAQNTTLTQNATGPYPNGTSIITSAPVAAIPTNVAQHVNPHCGQYYTTVEGDYCNLLIVKFAISLDDFLFLNKDVNANCTNLLARYSYCVKPVGDSKFGFHNVYWLSLKRCSQYIQRSTWVCEYVVRRSHPDAQIHGLTRSYLHH